jgi:hypothetical protein
VLKTEILTEMRRMGILKKNEYPQKPHYYPSLQNLNFERAEKAWDPQKHGNAAL